jgi:hypothetical protein
MAKEKKKTEPKPRAEKYDEKLAINGTFEGVIKAAFKRDIKCEDKKTQQE